MIIPNPVPGLVVRYNCLWRDESIAGREEGVKARPCAVVLAAKRESGGTVVLVVPITHSPPRDAALGIELPRDLKRRLGLDDERSWVVVSDANTFLWPGPDILPVPKRRPASFAYGHLPANLTREIIKRVGELARAGRLRRTDRPP